MKENNRTAWGISLLIAGLFFLFKQLGIIPPIIEEYIFNWKNLPFVIGIVFLFAQKNKTNGLIFIAIGVLLYIKEILEWAKDFSNFIWPLLLIGAGMAILISSKSKVEKSPDNLPPQSKNNENPIEKH